MDEGADWNRVAGCVRSACLSLLPLGMMAADAAASGGCPSVGSPFPIDGSEVVLRSRCVEVRGSADPESLLHATVVDSLWNPTAAAIFVDLGILTYPPIESAESLDAARVELRWNDQPVSVQLRPVPPRDWNELVGLRFAELPLATIKVKPGSGVLAYRQRVAWTLGIVNGVLDQETLSVFLSGLGAWAGRPKRVDVNIRIEPRVDWVEWLAAEEAHPRAITARPEATRVDQEGVWWTFRDWEPTEGRSSHDVRLLLTLEPNETSR